MEFVVSGAVKSLSNAFQALEPAELFVSRGTGFADNRRGYDYTDDEITVLDARSLDGDRLGTFVNFAAHPTWSP